MKTKILAALVIGFVITALAQANLKKTIVYRPNINGEKIFVIDGVTYKVVDRQYVKTNGYSETVFTLEQNKN